MFDPRDLSDSRQGVTVDPLQVARRERIDIGERIERAMADMGMYRSVAYRDLSEAHSGGHPYATRRGVDRMVRSGKVVEHRAEGRNLYGAHAHRARSQEKRGNTPSNMAWIPGNAPTPGSPSAANSHTTPPSTGPDGPRGARIAETGGVVRRIRIDAELKSRIAQATEKARAEKGNRAADAARFRMAEELGLPVKDGKVLYPDAQLGIRRRGKDERAAATSRWPPNITARERSRPSGGRLPGCTATVRQRGGPCGGRWSGAGIPGDAGAGLAAIPHPIEL